MSFFYTERFLYIYTSKLTNKTCFPQTFSYGVFTIHDSIVKRIIYVKRKERKLRELKLGEKILLEARKNFVNLDES